MIKNIRWFFYKHKSLKIGLLSTFAVGLFILIFSVFMFQEIKREEALMIPKEPSGAVQLTNQIDPSVFEKYSQPAEILK